MLDKNFITNNQQAVKTAMVSRGKDPILVDQVVEMDKNRRNLQLQIDDKRAEQNKISRAIHGKPTEEQLSAAKAIKEVLTKLEEQDKFVADEFNQLLEQLPNIPAADVPVGKDDSENVVIKTVGTAPKFDFQPKDHVELGKLCDIIDIEKAATISGSRFGYYKGEAAQLELTLMWYVFMKLSKKGFKAMIPPTMIKHDTEWRMGYVSNQALAGTYYYMPEDDLTFISSSEHSVGPYHMEETLNAASLPLRYVNFSPCFRREAGTYGKDMKGMFRLHCFNKVEMIAFTLPDFKESDAMCDALLAEEEEVLQELGLHYQVMKVCTGDMPYPNRKQYDINTWFPGQNAYRETSSCSNCTDYQSRRLGTKVKLGTESKFVHMLNATAVVDRVVIAILENFQQADGSILMPKVLQPLLGFDIIKAHKL